MWLRLLKQWSHAKWVLIHFPDKVIAFNTVQSTLCKNGNSKMNKIYFLFLQREKVRLNPYIVTLLYLTWKYAHTYVSYKNENYLFPILWIKESINITFTPEHFWRSSILWRESTLQYCFSYSCRCIKPTKASAVEEYQ